MAFGPLKAGSGNADDVGEPRIDVLEVKVKIY
jgi:hypothetical protein